MEVVIDQGEKIANISQGVGNASYHYTGEANIVTTANIIQDVLYVIITPIICIFGFVGNLCSLVVLIRVRARSMRKAESSKESTALLGMVLLAISDMCFCLVLFPRALVTASSNTSIFVERGFGLYYQTYGTGLVTTFILTSTWITVVLSLFRYVGICHPLQARHLIGPTGTRLTYLITIMSCIILNLPSFWQYRICPFPYQGNSYYMIDIGVFDLNKTAGIAFLWIRNTIGLLLPTILLSFCNWSLIKALRESQRMHKRCHVSEMKSQSSFKITLTLIIIVVMFILLVFPCEVLDFLHDLMDISRDSIEIFLVIRAFANILQVINFASNFILYCAIGGQFRSVLCDTFCRCCCPTYRGKCRSRKRNGIRHRYSSMLGQHSHSLQMSHTQVTNFSPNHNELYSMTDL